ncbi:hydroxymethylpyrimidine/phosphomethylpyrimidine kinase [Labilibacter sediminis]|nr:hydroxymethylpyrimidine/phosphomethylpyrimidine kinase [Labilibacter sediminis]
MASFPQPYVLSIAGHDPCAGAGLTADLKTFEHHKVYGLSVVTAITVQNDYDFKDVQWVDINLIEDQVKILFEAYKIDFVKIGLIENFSVLKRLLELLKEINPEVKIIWDPILKSSSGYGFHEVDNFNEELLNHLYLITPNAEEYELLQKHISDISSVNCLLKGGHSEEHKGTDILKYQGQQISIKGESFNGKSKHGTGCVLSSAIVSNLVNGMDMKNACIQAKKYVEQYILSTDENLGIHQF